MKLHEKTNRMIVDGALAQGESGIDIEDISFITKVLRDDMYSDKAMAVVREYCTNGADANLVYSKEKGIKEKPIFITVPTPLEPVMKIRDFGHGMSKEDVLTNYFKYGKSTKRGKDQLNGYFGIGCKVGWAYGDSYLVHSYHGGFKRTYAATLNNTGEGQSFLISEEPSSETGMEIEINIQTKDVELFRQKIKHIASFLRITPETSVDLGVKSYRDSKVEIMEGVYVNESGEIGFGITNRYYRGDYKLTAVMGGVSYPVQSDLFFEGVTLSSKEIDDITKLFQRDLFIEFDIDKYPLVMHPSREKISYESQTYASLKLRLQDIIKSIKAEEEKRFNESSTALEAYKKYKSRIFLDQDSSWNGIKFDLIGFSVETHSDARKWSYCYYDKSKITSGVFNSSNSWTSDSVTFDNLVNGSAIFMIKTDKDKGQITPRVRTLLDKQGYDTVYVIEHLVKSQQQIEKAFPQFFVKFNDVDETAPPKKQGSSSGGSNSNGPRFSTKYTDFRFNTLRLNYDQTWSANWTEIEEKDLPAVKVYIEVSRNKPVKYAMYRTFYNRAKVVLFINDAVKIIGVKTAQLPKIKKDKSWIELSEYINKKSARLISELKCEKIALKKYELPRHSDRVLKFGGHDANNIKTYWSRSSSDKGSYCSCEIDEVAKLIDFNLKKSVEEVGEKYMKLRKEILDKYPVLRYINWDEVKSDFNTLKEDIESSCS